MAELRGNDKRRLNSILAVIPSTMLTAATERYAELQDPKRTKKNSKREYEKWRDIIIRRFGHMEADLLWLQENSIYKMGLTTEVIRSIPNNAQLMKANEKPFVSGRFR